MVLVAGFCGGAALVLPLMQKGRLALRVGMMAGLLALGASAFFLSRLDAGCSWLDVAWPLGLFGIGYAFCLNTGYAACPERGGGAFRRRFLPGR